MANLIVSDRIVAALDQVAVAVGRRVDLFRLAAHLHGLLLRVGANLSLAEAGAPHLEPRLAEYAIEPELSQPTLAYLAKPR